MYIGKSTTQGIAVPKQPRMIATAPRNHFKVLFLFIIRGITVS